MRLERLLVDAKVSGASGGTGTSFDWTLVQELARERNLIVAGGLRPENVAGAVTLWFLLQASWPRFQTALERGESVGVVGRFLIPTWPIKLILVAGAVMMIVQFVLFAAMAAARAVKGPEVAREGVAAPAPEAR